MTTGNSMRWIYNTASSFNIGGKFFQLFVSVTSIAFYIAGLFTLLNVLQRLLSIHSISSSELSTIFLQFLFLCFAVLDFIVGYGLSNRRKWALTVILISLIAVSALNLSRYLSLTPPEGISLFALFLPTAVLGTIATVLSLNLKFLNGTLIDKKVVFSFSAILLTTIMFNETIALLLSYAQ